MTVEQRRNIIFISGIAVLTLMLMLFFKYNSAQIGGMIVDGKENLAEFYSKSLKPLFTSEPIDKKDIFTFASSGILPLERGNKYLSVKNEYSGASQIEIKNSDLEPENSYHEFITRNNLSQTEISKLDSVLEDYQDELMVSVFENGEETYAINKELALVREAIQLDIQNLIQRIKAGNKFRETQFANLDSIRFEIKRIIDDREEDFVVISPDTVIDMMANLEPLFEDIKNNFGDYGEFDEELRRKLEEKNIAFEISNSTDSLFTFKIDSDSGTASISFMNPDIDKINSLAQLMKINVFKENKNVDVSFGYDSLHNGFGFHVVEQNGDSTTAVSVNFNLNNLTKLIGSSMTLMSEMQGKSDEEIQAKMDSIVKKLNFVNIDSLKKSLKKKKEN